MWAANFSTGNGIARGFQILFVLVAFVLLLTTCGQTIYKVRVQHVEEVDDLLTGLLVTQNAYVNLWKQKLESCTWSTNISLSPTNLRAASEVGANLTKIMEITNSIPEQCTTLLEEQDKFKGFAGDGCKGDFVARFNTIATFLVTAVCFAFFGVVTSIVGFFRTTELPRNTNTGIIGSAFVASMLVAALTVTTYTFKCERNRLADTYVQPVKITPLTFITSYTDFVTLAWISAALLFVATFLSAFTGGDNKELEYEEYE